MKSCKTQMEPPWEPGRPLRKEKVSFGEQKKKEGEGLTRGVGARNLSRNDSNTGNFRVNGPEVSVGHWGNRSLFMDRRLR